MWPINAYCKNSVEGWHDIAQAIPVAKADERHFLNPKEGIHLMASVKDYGKLQSIHVSIGVVQSLRPDKTEQELVEHGIYEAAGILQQFFGNRAFLKAPDDPRRPSVKHYFSLLEDNQHERN